jgi:hypothetical protein
MKRIMQFMLFAALLLTPLLANAQQNTLTATTLSAAITSSSANYITVASATGISAQGSTNSTNTQVAANQTVLYIDRELMQVIGVNGTSIHVVRGFQTQAGTVPAQWF